MESFIRIMIKLIIAVYYSHAMCDLARHLKIHGSSLRHLGAVKVTLALHLERNSFFRLVRQYFFGRDRILEYFP